MSNTVTKVTVRAVSSGFGKEEEMYPILKTWLETEKGCSQAYHVKESSFSFKPADRRKIPDVIGSRVGADGTIEIISIEAKKSVSDSNEVLNQVQGGLAFCQRVYLAVPKKEYDAADNLLKERLYTRIASMNVGLLLVLKTRVDEILPAPSQHFQVRLYNEALAYLDELSEKDYYLDNEGQWTLEQSEQFKDAFHKQKHRGFLHTIDDYDVTEEGSTDIIEFTGPYSDDIEGEIALTCNTVRVCTRVLSRVDRVVDNLLKYSSEDVEIFFSSYEKESKTWKQFGMNSSPSLELRIPNIGFAVSMNKPWVSGTLFNLGSFLMNLFFMQDSNNGRTSSTMSEISLSVEYILNRSEWHTAARKDEWHALWRIHQLLRESSEILSILTNEDE